MARRRQREESGGEPPSDIATLPPWQASVAIAVALFVGLHWYATSTPPAQDMKSQVLTLSLMLGHVGRTAAGFAQYMLPALFLAGAAASFFHRKDQAEIHARVAADPSAQALEKIAGPSLRG